MSNNISPVSLKTRILNALRSVFKISFFENWLTSKTLNQPPENFFVKLIPPNYTYKTNSNRLAIRNSFTYSLDLSDYVEHYIFWGIKDAGHELLYSRIESGMTVLDIGANIGDTALHFSKIVGTTGKIFAFEPDTDNYKKLTSNLNSNNVLNTHTYNIGLGSKADTLKLYRVDPANKGRNRLFLNNDDEATFTEVEIKTLDSVVHELKLNRIDFIKIDVEGFEFEVLKGAKALLNNYEPLLFIEINDTYLKGNNASADMVIDYLVELGYKIKIAQTGEDLTYPPRNLANRHFDIICQK